MALRTVLVVEDDTSLLAVLREHLEHEGFSVTAEVDGPWAIQTFEKFLPDIAIIDLLLPSSHGFDVARALRALPGGDAVPIIFMSGIYKGRRHRATATDELGAVELLAKPFELSRLTEVMRDVLLADYPGRRKSFVAPRQNEYGDDPLADQASRQEKQAIELSAQSQTSRFSGNLRKTDFAEVVARLARERVTGALFLRSEQKKKIVYFEDGIPVFVKSNLLSECLGRVLVREKIISEKECEDSLRAVKKSGRPQGEILVEQKALSPHNLERGLKIQLREKLFDVFRWEHGDFQFSTEVAGARFKVQVEMGPGTIIFEGALRNMTPTSIDNYIEPFLEKYITLHEMPLQAVSSLPLEADQKGLLDLVNGQRSAGEILKQSGLPMAEAKRVLCAFLAAEILAPKTRRIRVADGLADSKRDSPPPLKTQPPPLVDGDENRKKALTGQLDDWGRCDAYQILGLSEKAKSREICRAFDAATLRFKRERSRRSSSAVHDAIDELLARLQEAFAELSDFDARKALDLRRQKKQDGMFLNAAARTLQATRFFDEGRLHLDENRFGEAETALRTALSHRPEDGEIRAFLAWALRQQGAPPKEVEPMLLEAIRKDPRSYNAHIFLGLIRKASGRSGRQSFTRALECHPDGEEALRYLGKKGSTGSQ